MTNSNTTNSTVELLQQRHPDLLRDVAAHIQAQPASQIWTGGLLVPSTVVCRSTTYLIDDNDAASTADHLQHVSGPLVHLFTEVARFLHFLGQADAERCVTNDRYLPMLLIPLNQAAHTQRLLSKISPMEWPWFLLEAARFKAPGTAERAAALGGQLAGLLPVFVNRLAAAVALRYPQPVEPARILAEKSRPLKVLTLAFKGSSYQRYCARDMVDGLRAVGIDAQACISNGGPAHSWEFLSEIDRFHPDVLLLNGRGRTGFAGIPANLPVLSWDQDYMLSADAGYAHTRQPHDRLMVMVREWLDHARDNGVAASHVRYVNLGTNPDQYHPPTGPLAKPEYDVLFVGNIYPFEQYRKMIGFDGLPEPVRQLMLLGRERLDAWITSRGENEPFVIPDFDSFLRECQVELGHPPADANTWRTIVHYFRYRVAHLLVRERYLSALGDEFKLGLFGRGWDRFPALAAQAQPEIENGPPLREAIHRSAVNLHLHTWTVHHPRLYDTAAAGGFLLVGRVAEQVQLGSVFDEGRELDSFGSIAELKRKIRHYLDHPEDRQAIAAAAARRAAADHAMKYRMDQAVALLAA